MKKIMLSLVACLMAFSLCAGLTAPVLAVGNAPVAENFEFKTYQNTDLCGVLSAYDSEDDVVYYEITTQPVKGSIELQPDGSFVYTPREGKKGRDYFGYKAVDTEGNKSQEATVIIRIEKQK